MMVFFAIWITANAVAFVLAMVETDRFDLSIAAMIVGCSPLTLFLLMAHISTVAAMLLGFFLFVCLICVSIPAFVYTTEKAK